MASAPGDRVELLAGSLERQAVSDWSAEETRHDMRDDVRLVESARQG
jgi:hypothetical protein